MRELALAETRKIADQEIGGNLGSQAGWESREEKNQADYATVQSGNSGQQQGSDSRSPARGDTAVS